MSKKTIGIQETLRRVHEKGEPLVLDPISYFQYWESLPVQIKIEYLKMLAKTKYGLRFRGEKIKVIGL